MYHSYVYANSDGVVHAVMHDEQITRCADGPVGCWPGPDIAAASFCLELNSLNNCLWGTVFVYGMFPPGMAFFLRFVWHRSGTVFVDVFLSKKQMLKQQKQRPK